MWDELMGMRRFLLALVVLLPLALPAAAGAQAPASCSARINGQDVRQHDSAGSAIRVDPDDLIQLELVLLQPVRSVEIEISAGPLKRTLHPSGAMAPRSNTRWNGTADASDVASFGVGLYEARLTADESCELSAWVDIQGNPLLTVAGAAAAAVLLVGLGVQTFGVVRGLKGRGGFK